MKPSTNQRTTPVTEQDEIELRTPDTEREFALRGCVYGLASLIGLAIAAILTD